MSFRTSVSIVASPRPRVGKTLLARLLTDFHIQEGRSVAAFDLNDGEGTLAEFLPGHVTRSAVGDIKQQMALFDALVAEDETAKVIDLGAGAFDAFFKVAAQIGFAEETSRRGIAPIILFMATPDRTSVEAYAALQALLPQATITPVNNDLLGAAQNRSKYPLARGALPVRFSALAPALRKYVETPPFSFADSKLGAALSIPIDAHLELQRWLRRIFVEFRELDLRTLLADLKSAIKI